MQPLVFSFRFLAPMWLNDWLIKEPITTASYLIKNGTVDGTPVSIEILSTSDHRTEAGNAIRSAIIDVQPFNKYLSATDLQRSSSLLSDPPPGLSEPQFKVMRKMIQTTDVPQMEFAWV